MVGTCATGLNVVRHTAVEQGHGAPTLAVQVNNLISQAPEVAVPLRSDSTQTWTLNTYVDADTRICRGDGGSVYIYTRAY
jgi:hypothetical protein